MEHLVSISVFGDTYTYRSDVLLSCSYSGDTRPCQNFVQESTGVTLMIHEATFADDEADLAVQKKHSTFSEALDVGRR